MLKEFIKKQNFFYNIKVKKFFFKDLKEMLISFCQK